MAKTAMRDSNGTPVFVHDNGEYAYTFPEENVVRKANTDNTKFKVYGFVGDEEVVWEFDDEETALDHATQVYGETDVDVSITEREVYEVEVHEVDQQQ